MKAQLRKDRSFWQRVYSDVRNKEHFRAWLAVLLSVDGQDLVPEPTRALPLRRACGFYTGRFLSLFAEPTALTPNTTIGSPDELRSFYDRHKLTNHFIRTENLHEDLTAFIRTHIDPGYESEVSKRLNSSSRARDHRAYYDDRSLELIREQDFLIFETFGY